MYDHQLATAAGSAHREHLLAQAEHSRLVKASRSKSAVRAGRPRGARWGSHRRLGQIP